MPTEQVTIRTLDGDCPAYLMSPSGDGSWPAARVATALAARDRAASGPTAPAEGLCLMRVTYPVDPFAD